MSKYRWHCSVAAKAVAIFLLTIMCATVFLSIAGAIFIWDMNMYFSTEQAVKEDMFVQMGYSDARQVAFDILHGDASYAQQVADGCAAEFQVRNENDVLWESCEDFDGFSQNHTTYRMTYEYVEHSYRNADSGDYATSYYLSLCPDYQDYRFDEEQGENETILLAINMVLDEDFSQRDKYAFANWAIGLLYALRYGIYAIMAGSVLLAIVCLIYLLCVAGHHRGEEDLRGSVLTKLPFDLYTFCMVMAVIFGGVMISESSWSGGEVLVVIVAFAVGMIGIPLIALWLMDFALRLKLGKWWKNTLIFRFLHLLWRLVRHLGRGGQAFFKALAIHWKVGAGLLALSLLELFVICITLYTEALPFIWLLSRVVVVPLWIFAAEQLKRLQAAGRALAAGDLSYHADTQRMLPDFKEHGENLNSIALGMNRAVEERMKSERLKTELITNVSHDIKPPLTSIINYADLIGREESGNPKIHEYADVLLRQSTRLKKLLEDLMDASKASTGNLEVLRAPCECGVLLTQTAGEYEQRLRECGLTLIVKQAEEPVRILADGRHMARIFDNLLNNICKYALPGTRVYLTLENVGEKAVFSFKNTSRSALDISADELMERFVRGDSSRSTEGCGLGLSIARSLTQLQGGHLDLTVDGDLFKAVLSFETI